VVRNKVDLRHDDYGGYYSYRYRGYGYFSDKHQPAPPTVEVRANTESPHNRP
jgi:hypothetical protein